MSNNAYGLTKKQNRLYSLFLWTKKKLPLYVYWIHTNNCLALSFCISIILRRWIVHSVTEYHKGDLLRLSGFCKRYNFSEAHVSKFAGITARRLGVYTCLFTARNFLHDKNNVNTFLTISSMPRVYFSIYFWHINTQGISDIWVVFFRQMQQDCSCLQFVLVKI